MSNPFRLKRIGGGSTLRGGDGLRGRQGIFPSGSLASSGVLVKHLYFSLTGAISTLTGTVAKLVSPTTYTGAISTITSTITNYKVIVLSVTSAISTLTGSLQSQINLPFSGTIANSGSLVKNLTLNAFTGAISTLTSTLVNLSFKFIVFTSSIGLAGAFQIQLNLPFSGTIASAGTLVKNLFTSYTGAISTLTGSLATLKIKFLEVAGVISTLTGTFQSNINLAITGALVSAGNLIKSVSANYTGVISTLTGALTKRINLGTAFTGNISTLTGALTRIPALNNLAGVITNAGSSLTKHISFNISGAVSTLTGAVTKHVTQTLAGVISTITGVGVYERITPPATMTLTAVSETTMTLTAVSGTTVTLTVE